MTRILKWTLQASILGAFVAYLAWPNQPLPGEVVFRVDALAMGAAALAARTVFVSLLFSLGLLALTFFMGRVFCGWACPLGTAVDAVDFVFHRRPRFPALGRVKYHLLVALFCISACGVAAAWLLDPMAWASRLHTLLALPVAPDWVMVASLGGALVIIELLLGRRAFCRVLCPLGALLGSVAAVSPFARRLSNSCTACAKCATGCRMAAIDGTPQRFSRAECVHCQDCVAGCPESALGYRYFGSAIPRRPDPLRRQYLLSLGGGVAAGLLLRKVETAQASAKPILPPGAVPGDRFGELCIRCGACIRVCPEKCLKPATDEVGPLLFQVPILETRDAGCAFGCNACGKVCPTGAIRQLSLTEKQKEKIGMAAYDQNRCVVLSKGSPCVICYTECPVGAIRFKRTDTRLKWGGLLYKPHIVKDKCTGCGLCEAICPVAGDAGIRIAPPQQ